jgi:hypothetical protein
VDKAYFEGPPESGLVRNKYIKDEEANKVFEKPRRGIRYIKHESPATDNRPLPTDNRFDVSPGAFR